MANDDLQAWVDCIGRRRYADLSAAVWDLLWLAAQHPTFMVRPVTAAGLEFTVGGEEPRVYPLGASVDWMRTVLARMGSLLKDRGAVETATCHYGFKARIKMPDSEGTHRPFEIEMKNNPREGCSLFVRRVEVAPAADIGTHGEG